MKGIQPMPDSTDTNWTSGWRTKMPESSSSDIWKPFFRNTSTEPDVNVDMRP